MKQQLQRETCRRSAQLQLNDKVPFFIFPPKKEHPWRTFIHLSAAGAARIALIYGGLIYMEARTLLREQVAACVRYQLGPDLFHPAGGCP
jgi:hypothetical protein